MKQNYIRLPQTLSGFTLIEFIVASALAIIVIMAAGSTYVMTHKLNSTAQQRLSIQQNLRNASIQISRDARLAGAFGCFSTGNMEILKNSVKPDFTKISTGNNSTAKILIDTDKDDGLGVYSGQFNHLPALFFVYGEGERAITQIQGLSSSKTNNISSIKLVKDQSDGKELDPLTQTLSAGGDVVLSSCRNAVAFKSDKTNSQVINTSNKLNNVEFSKIESGELVLSKLQAAAYVFDDSKKTLYRVTLGNDGLWQSPQVVSTGINNMQISYGYTDDCPTGYSGATSDTNAASSIVADETYSFSNDPAEKKLPSLVQVRLNYDVNLPDNKGVNVTHSQADYVINATVRSGNTCATRMPIATTK